MTERIVKAIGAVELFSHLPLSFQTQLAQFSMIRQVRAGETIFCQGEPSPYCFGIVSGQVTIQRMPRERGFAPKTLSILGAGAIFGEQALFKDSPRTAMAQASQSGELVAIQGKAMREWLEKDPYIGISLMSDILQSTLSRLHQTSHELSLVYGIGRTLATDTPFEARIRETTGFLRVSLEDIDEVFVYRKNPYWDEFEPIVGGKTPTPRGVIASQDPLLLQAQAAEKPVVSSDEAGRAAVAIVPFFDPTDRGRALRGFLWIGSMKNKAVFSSNILMVLNAISMPFFEALQRQRHLEDLQAQNRLYQNRQSFRM